MSAVWMRIEARELGDLDPAVFVAGLPRISRLMRMAARADMAGAVVVADTETVDRLRKILAKRPEFSIPLEAASAPPSDERHFVDVDIRAVYDRRLLPAAIERAITGQESKLEPLLVLESRRDVGVARAALHQTIAKSVLQDGVFAVTTQRPLARPVTYALLPTKVKPNHVTTVALFVGLTAAFLASRGEPLFVALAGLLYWAGAVVDCIDGDLARLRMEFSKSGEWLDTLADDLATFSLMVGLGAGIAHAGRGDEWMWLGIAGGAIGMATQAYLYWQLHRMGSVIDTAQFPWFFGKPSAQSDEQRSPVGWVFFVISMLFRRDAFVTIIGIMLAVGLWRLALSIMIVGVAIVAILLPIHWIVMAMRRDA